MIRANGEHTAVFNDVLFNMPHASGIPGVALRLAGSSGGPRVSRIARWFLVKDGQALAAHLARIADLPGLRSVVVSHHEVIDQDPAGTLRRVAATL